MEDFFAVRLDPSFPVAEIEQVSEFLLAKDCLVPGYPPPNAGLLDVASMYYSQNVDEQQTVVLPDRNLVGRMAEVARIGVTDNSDPTKIAINLMAYCQCLNVLIEPSIAFHELAAARGNEAALEELAWFRLADKANPEAWIEGAIGNSMKPLALTVEPVDHQDLAFPPHRWRRNYIVALKIAELELSNLLPHERMVALLNWMRDDFLVAGPAAALAVFYLSPDSPRKGTFKNLRSSDRSLALKGIRNEAWDITQMSDFMRRLQSNDHNRFIFATADKRLGVLARSLIPHNDQEEFEEHAYRNAHEWWPAKHANKIAVKLIDVASEANNRPRRKFEADMIEKWTLEGEEKVRLHKP